MHKVLVVGGASLTRRKEQKPWRLKWNGHNRVKQLGVLLTRPGHLLLQEIGMTWVRLLLYTTSTEHFGWAALVDSPVLTPSWWCHHSGLCTSASPYHKIDIYFPVWWQELCPCLVSLGLMKEYHLVLWNFWMPSETIISSGWVQKLHLSWFCAAVWNYLLALAC